MPFKVFPINNGILLKADVGYNRVKIKSVDTETNKELKTVKVYYDGTKYNEKLANDSLISFLEEQAPEQSETILVWVGKYLK